MDHRLKVWIGSIIYHFHLRRCKGEQREGGCVYDSLKQYYPEFQAYINFEASVTKLEQ